MMHTGRDSFSGMHIAYNISVVVAGIQRRSAGPICSITLIDPGQKSHRRFPGTAEPDLRCLHLQVESKGTEKSMGRRPAKGKDATVVLFGHASTSRCRHFIPPR